MPKLKLLFDKLTCWEGVTISHEKNGDKLLRCIGFNGIWIILEHYSKEEYFVRVSDGITDASRITHHDTFTVKKGLFNCAILDPILRVFDMELR